MYFFFGGGKVGIDNSYNAVMRSCPYVNVHVVLVDLFLDEALVANLADIRHLRVLKRENKCKISFELE